MSCATRRGSKRDMDLQQTFGVAFNLLRLQILRRTETIEDSRSAMCLAEEVVPFSGNPLKRKAAEDEEHEVDEEDIEDF